MTRATTCALIVALQKFSPCTAEKLAAECLTEPSNVRQWLYEFESVGIVKRDGKLPGVGRGSGRAQILWRWLSLIPAQIVENNSLHPPHGDL